MYNIRREFAKAVAETMGTFTLVFGGCGSAIFAAEVLSGPVNMGIGFFGVAFAFGLTVLCCAHAFGHISGGHFNPAVTIGLACARRFKWTQVPLYILSQLVGASAAGLFLYLIAHGKSGFSAVETGFATNGYGDRSPNGYTATACFFTEFILTGLFLFVILGATDTRHNKAIAPIAVVETNTIIAPISIGLMLTLIHLISIPITNTSVNPARSLGVAWFAGKNALQQVWMFIVAPIAGAAIAGCCQSLLDIIDVEDNDDNGSYNSNQ